MKYWIIMLILCIDVTLAYAQKTGNGGDAVVKGNQVSLLDLVENQNQFLSVEDSEILRVVHLSMSKINWFVSKPKSITWILANHDLPDVPDEGYLEYKETDAEIKQLAIQRDNIVVIDKKLFDRLPKEHQLGLILHELLINTALKIGKNLDTAQGTQNIRKITAIILAKNAEQVPADYVRSIWDQIPNRPNSMAALNINRPQNTTYGSGDFPSGQTTVSEIENPVSEYEGNYYPILIEGSANQIDLINSASNGCRDLGISFYHYIAATELKGKAIVVDLSGGTKKLKTVGKGSYVIGQLGCKINVSYFW